MEVHFWNEGGGRRKFLEGGRSCKKILELVVHERNVPR